MSASQRSTHADVPGEGSLRSRARPEARSVGSPTRGDAERVRPRRSPWPGVGVSARARGRDL